MLSLVHTDDPDNHQNEAQAQLFLSRMQALGNIKLVCQLAKSMQRHRGASMGFLSGEHAFLPLLEDLKRSIDLNLTTLILHNQCEKPALSKHQLEQISNEWKTIVIGWQEDKILRNFEFHCHLINELKKILRQLMRNDLISIRSPKGTDLRVLLEILLVQIPEVVESLGMLRALSTNAAVVKFCSESSHTKLSFLIKRTSELSLHLIESIVPLIKTDYPITGLKELKEQQKNTQKLLVHVQMNILDSSNITTSGEELFDQSTEVIDTYWNVINEGVHRLEDILYTQLTPPIMHYRP